MSFSMYFHTIEIAQKGYALNGRYFDLFLKYQKTWIPLALATDARVLNESTRYGKNGVERSRTFSCVAQVDDAMRTQIENIVNARLGVTLRATALDGTKYLLFSPHTPALLAYSLQGSGNGKLARYALTFSGELVETIARM